MLACIGFNSSPFWVLKNTKKYNKFLGLVLSQFRLSSDKPSNGMDLSLFENAQLQKYLHFITNSSSKISGEFLEANKVRQIAELFRNKNNLKNELINLKKLYSEGDDELKKLVELEEKEFLDKIEEIKSEILNCISADDLDENRNVEVQIISGIGGEEAKLFRNELFQMYTNYAEFKNWECVHEPNSDYMLITGKSVYGHLRHEGGVHRVQRVPETEKQNRVHTSTCSVVILPQPKPQEIEIRDKDLHVERLRSSGPGGQNVNKTESCVRITHIPSGVVVENQTSRFQYENKKIAIERLRGILFNMEQNRILNDRKNRIKGQAGTNDYADKIRTYNFPQNRITDHRLNYSVFNIKGFLSGTRDLDSMIGKLRESQKRNSILEYIDYVLQSIEYKNFEKQQVS